MTAAAPPNTRRQKPLTVAELLVEHELHPTCRADGMTMWTCRHCKDVSIESATSRHAPAQAEHQVAILTELGKLA